MVKKTTSHQVESRDSWAAKVAALGGERAAPRRRKPPITVERIVQTALALVAAEGFDALTMRRVAGVLETGPASLYAHVRDKAELDDLLIGELCARVILPAPAPAVWTAQFKGVCGQLRDLYLEYPGISLAAFAAVPRNLDTLRINEGLLAILLAGGVAAQPAAWAIDAAILYVGAYSLERSLRQRPGMEADGRPFDRTEIAERLRMLPLSHFPNTVAHVQEIVSGDGHDRFDFTLDLLLGGLAPASAQHGHARERRALDPDRSSS
ncbi:TetR/AcrR family transcriptional regulator [Pollutimonas bauzanensis]|nr:TetR/AcrR family transcriptional regulator [Pollutimonas bauzanensis]